MVFDPKKYIIKVQGGRQYLPVSARLIWFREQHPDWGIETRPVVIDTDKQFAIFEATVFNETGKLMAKGTKMEDVRGFPDYVEKAETGSIGRALAVCGFGTQFAPELDETAGERFVDSPQAPRNGNGAPNANGASNGNRSYGQNNARYANQSGDYNGPGAVTRSGGYNQPRPESPAPPRPVEAPRPTTGVATGDDPFEDKHPPAEPKPTAPIVEAEPKSEHGCTACGRELNHSQEALSVRKYGIALCPTCQRERRTAEA